MRAFGRSLTMLCAMALLAAAPSALQERGGQEEFGPYEPVENWLQPLPDGPDGVKHDGWTWGSVGAVFAETPDRIWIAQRGELPLPPRPHAPSKSLSCCGHHWTILPLRSTTKMTWW